MRLTNGAASFSNIVKKHTFECECWCFYRLVPGLGKTEQTKEDEISYNNRFLYSFTPATNVICQGVGYIHTYADNIFNIVYLLSHPIKIEMSFIASCLWFAHVEESGFHKIRKKSRFSSHKPIFIRFFFSLFVECWFLFSVAASYICRIYSNINVW